MSALEAGPRVRAYVDLRQCQPGSQGPRPGAAAAGRVGCADLDAEKRRRWTSRRQIKRNQRVAARLQELLGDEWVFADEAEILSDVSEDEDERAAASADEDDSGDVFTWTTRGLHF